MIRVSGQVTLKVDYDIEIDMTEQKFEDLSYGEKYELIDSLIDWREACSNAMLEEVEVNDIEEI